MSRMKEHVMNMQLPGAEPLPQASLVEALANAQSEMRNPAFDKVNPHFKSISSMISSPITQAHL